ncbi:prostate stem cell antigen-like [Nelusetta ayraudi]|uniref:prostate stem cell antigen-like n=1 Tax=Nelusetta ayraudi TaxID=303726 RepID=UPI003F704DFD
MNRIILQLVAVGFCFALGQALQCYDCKVGFWNFCITGKIQCDAGQHCFSGVGQAVSLVDIKMKGCLAKVDCNKTTTVNFPTSDSNATAYHMNKTCCNTDLCNGAPALQRAGGLSLALASVVALFVVLH